LVLYTLRPYLGKLRIDYVSFAEDLAYKGGPHISPSIYKEFFLPYQDPIIDELKKRGINLVSMYTAGNIKPILPLLIEHGFNCTWPIERGSLMDPIALRQMYGKDLRLVGGIAKESLIAGTDAIDRELERLMPLIVEGGYIPAIDDMIPPEVSFSSYRYYVDAIKSIKL
jgi:uroporphyrinogen decarboxylase